jgi:hypothetical protein
MKIIVVAVVAVCMLPLVGIGMVALCLIERSWSWAIRK